MTTAAICATREVSSWPSYYRGEQYDSDLGLYYLRARYYNPATGRFLSRDPEDGKTIDPKTLHKYLYANGDPVNRIDPKGKDGFDEYLDSRSFEVEEGMTEEEKLNECLDFAFAYYLKDLIFLDYRDPLYLEEVLDTLWARCKSATFPAN